MPHFLPSGNVVWNDSHEPTVPHGTGFGNWMPIGDDGHGVKAVGVLQKYDVSVPNSFGGAFKLKFNGAVDPANPNSMTGSVELVNFDADDIPLPSPNPELVFHRDANDTGGESAGTYTIVELRRIRLASTTTAVEEIESSDLPTDFFLSEVYPNPFKPTSTIRFTLPVEAEVKIRVYNIGGQVVRELANDRYSPGQYSVTWDGTDNDGHKVTSGVYIYRTEALGFSLAKKVTLLK